MNDDEIRLFWAKLSPDSGHQQAYHPLLCHMTDVAMVAQGMWHAMLSPQARLSITLALAMTAQDDAGRWISFWAGLHDLGKASPAFQLQGTRQYPALRSKLEAAGLFCPQPPPPASSVRHGMVSALELIDLLPEDYQLSTDLASRVAVVVGGHHGVFPTSSVLRDARLRKDAVGRTSWAQARRTLARQLADVLHIPGTEFPQQLDNATAMVLAGLTSVADWIGSNEGYFRYAVQDTAVPPPDLGAYEKQAEQQAAQALQDLCWTALVPEEGHRTFSAVFPLGGRDPFPMQRTVEDLTRSLDRPGLVIIEAPMGEGKTEAALYLADHWAANLGQLGSYVALPTQATSDQMFSRVREFLHTRYPEARVNLQLLHGHASLNAEFQTMTQESRSLSLQGIDDDPGYDHASANVVAAEWFTARKRGLLAPFGVGTIDQALLAVLQTKHMFVRLFGLAHKTVIIDEVHAYDTYMTALLERLLEWLAALDSSVVLLSATLPKGRRDALLQAYRRGRGAAPTTIPDVSYPRLSWVTAVDAGALPVAAAERSRRDLGLKWIDGRPETLGPLLEAALAEGGCVAVICNTVDRAQRVYQALKPFFPGDAEDGEPELGLLHARFLYDDRQLREKHALVRFGKPDGTVDLGDQGPTPVRRPKRAVLVATQIIEQSLDLDFDLMVTDFAPADLLLQRSGRLHRHEREERPTGLKKPVLWVCAPEVEDDVPIFGPANQAVYDPHILLRSWLALRGRDRLRVPDDVESLIEAVYGADVQCPPNASAALHGRWDETRQREREAQESDRREAEDRWLKPPSFSGLIWHFTADPREEDAPDFHQAHQALTRLSDPSVAVVILYGTPERPAFEPAFDLNGASAVNLSAKPSTMQAQRLLRRSVSISDRRVVHTLLAQDVPKGWAASPLLRHHRVCILNSNGDAVIGRFRLHLDQDVGLRVESVERGTT